MMKLLLKRLILWALGDEYPTKTIIFADLKPEPNIQKTDMASPQLVDIRVPRKVNK